MAARSRRAGRYGRASRTTPSPHRSPRACVCRVLPFAVKIGRPGYRVTEQFDMNTQQRSLLFQVRGGGAGGVGGWRGVNSCGGHAACCAAARARRGASAKRGGQAPAKPSHLHVDEAVQTASAQGALPEQLTRLLPACCSHTPLTPLLTHTATSAQVEYPEIEEGIKPRHRFMSAYEQRVETADKGVQYLIFAAEPYENIAFKIPNNEVGCRQLGACVVARP